MCNKSAVRRILWVGVSTAQSDCALPGGPRAAHGLACGVDHADAESSAADYFAAEFKAQRAKRGWTQAETGNKIGYSGSYVSDIERGARLATLDIARACDRVFGTPGDIRALA